MKFRVRIPGGVPDFFALANALVLALLQLGCGKDGPAARQHRPASVIDAPRGGAVRASSRCEFESRCLFPRARRPRVRTAALHAVYAGSSPAGNANGGGGLNPVVSTNSISP